MKNRNEEYEALKKKALEQFKTGQPLLGKDGPMSLRTRFMAILIR